MVLLVLIIFRILLVARKARTEGLTEAEKTEQAALRREYVEAVKQSLQANLDNTFIQTHDGKRRRLERKGDGD
jgi:uncharacterized protein YnzC (UPF0291/DUF896 family)